MSETKQVSKSNRPNGPIGVKDLRNLLDGSIDRIRSILPQAHRHQAERFVARACLTFLNAEPKVQEKLARCTRESLFSSVLEAAECGFAIDGRFAYWIPYGQVAQCQFDYKALIARARRAGLIVDARGQVVHENDTFDWWDENGKQVYRYKPAKEKHGKIIGAYCVVTISEGVYRFEYLDVDELEKIRKCSKSPESPAWKNFLGQMYIKCALKRILKTMQDDPGLIQMMEIDDREFDMDKVVEGRVVSKGNKSGTMDDLADSLESAPAITHQPEPMDFGNPSSMTPEEQADAEAAYAESGADSNDMPFGG